MSNDNTAKPTEGPWIVFTPEDREDCQTLGVESFDGKAVVWYGEFFDDGIPNDADAYLIAEAGTVYHETGLTPRQLASELNAHKAARIAYANEFPLNADDEPDVGSIHENIRKLAEQRDKLLAAAKRFLAAGDSTLDACRDDVLTMIEFAAAEDDLRAIIAKVEAKP